MTATMTAGGNALLDAVRCGDPAAMTEFVREHQALVFNYARRFLGDPRDGEEIAQDTFVRAITAMQKTYTETQVGQLKVRPWLLRIARNLALNRARHDRARPVTISDDNLAESVVPADPIALDAHDTLESALGRLDPRDREMVVLRFVSDLSYAEIAAALGCTESAARGRVFRALKQLRAVFTETRDADL